MYAKGGVGKSLFVLWLAIQAARDNKQIAIFDYEMTENDLYDRLLDMGLHPESEELNNIHYALIPALNPVDTAQGGNQIYELATRVNADLVIIDTFGRAAEGEENESKTVLEFYRHTASKLKRDGIATLRIDHAGKDARQGQRGTSAKNDDVDIVWKITRANNEVKLHAEKRRAGWVPETVTYHETRNPLDFHLETSSLPDDTSVTKETVDAIKYLDKLDVPVDARRTHWTRNPELRDHMTFRAFINAQKHRSNRVEHAPVIAVDTDDTIDLDELL